MLCCINNSDPSIYTLYFTMTNLVRRVNIAMAYEILLSNSICTWAMPSYSITTVNRFHKILNCLFPLWVRALLCDLKLKRNWPVLWPTLLVLTSPWFRGPWTGLDWETTVLTCTFAGGIMAYIYFLAFHLAITHTKILTRERWFIDCCWA